MSHIFISYSRQDSVMAELLRLYLENAGFKVWADIIGIEGGMNWREVIHNAVDDASAVIVILSSNSVNSSWVAFEAIYALAKEKILIPIVTERNIDIPDFLMHIQWLILDEPPYEKGLSSLVNVLGGKQSQIKEGEEAPSLEEVAKQKAEIEKEIIHQSRVFIAYSRKQRIIARQLSEMLYKHNKPNFWDAKIKAGAVWRQKIQKALDDATHLIIVWTQDAVDSNEVEREVSYALAEHKVIIPILSKDIPKLPYHLHGLHYVVMNDDLSEIENEIIQAIEAYSSDDGELWQ